MDGRQWKCKITFSHALVFTNYRVLFFCLYLIRHPISAVYIHLKHHKITELKQSLKEKKSPKEVAASARPTATHKIHFISIFIFWVGFCCCRELNTVPSPLVTLV